MKRKHKPEPKPKLEKELVGLAGEYAVASELCRRGLYSQLTLGHHKRTDILIETNARMLRISVKAKQDKVWPSVDGPVRDDDFLILVDFLDKQPGSQLDFYVVARSDWLVLVEDEVRRQKQKGKTLKITGDKVEYEDGWKGLNIKPEHVAVFKDAWNKIASAVTPLETA